MPIAVVLVRRGRVWAVPLMGLALVWQPAPQAAAEPPDEAESAVTEVMAVEAPRGRGREAPLPPSLRLGVDPGRVPLTNLVPPDFERLAQEDRERERSGAPGPRRVGVGTAVALGADDGQWYDLGSDGRLWIADLASDGALALRLHLRRIALPAEAELMVYAPDQSRTAFRRTGPHGPASAWTPEIDGERVRLELRLPAGADWDPGTLPFAVEALQHLYRDPLVDTAALFKACQLDATCYSQRDVAGGSTAHVNYVQDGTTFVTQGTLLASAKPDFTPLVLTTDFITAEIAPTATVRWNLRSTECGATTTSDFGVSSGATLLARDPRLDYSLLRIEGTIPLDPGPVWAGWSTQRPRDGTPVATLYHHNVGRSPRFIAFGATERCSDCGRNEWLRAGQVDGTFGHETSGAGFFRDDAKQQFIGHYYSAIDEGACAAPETVYFGAFASYYKQIKKHLSGTVDDSSEPNDSCAKPRTLPRATTLSGRIVKLVDEDWYKISVAPGKNLDVRIDFAHGAGDLDLQMYSTCAGAPIAASQSQDDGESVSLTNVGSKPALVWWRVYLVDDVRNQYDMTTTVH